MLTALRIRNLAIVESLEATFEPGLNVVTGETGAGKSVLVHALQLVLGGRAFPDLVRAGADKAEVEALLDLRDDLEARARLQAMDLPADDELVLRRTISAGRSRASVNGALITAAQLQQLGRGLCDITSQHEHHSLSDPASHLATLDGWIGRPDLLAEVRRTFEAAVAAGARLEELRARARDRADRSDLLTFQLGELRRVDPKEGEIEALREVVARARHAARLLEVGRRAQGALVGRERAICAELSRIEADLRSASAVDPSLARLAALVGSARLELDDAAGELSRWLGRVDLDPEEAARADERLAALVRVERRHGTLEAALAWRRQAEEELAVLDEAELHLDRLERELAGATRAAGAAARALSEVRRQRAEALGRAIGEELAELGMGGAEVRVEVEPLPAESGDLADGGARLTTSGIDRVELLVSPNPGEPPRPLHRIASGGELSRSLLATKRVLAGLGPVGTYVFDEVDTGVGGAVAEAIGRKLAEVGRHHQVICVTHQPQIAAFGRHHLHVSKGVREGRTTSRVELLGEGERVEELARMLGGRRVSDAAREAARVLLACREDQA